MTLQMQHIIRHLFQAGSLDEIPRERLEELVEQHPSFGIGHYLLSKKLQAENAERFSQETCKTNLYFTNPYWLQWLLDNTEERSATLVSSLYRDEALSEGGSTIIDTATGETILVDYESSFGQVDELPPHALQRDTEDKDIEDRNIENRSVDDRGNEIPQTEVHPEEVHPEEVHQEEVNPEEVHAEEFHPEQATDPIAEFKPEPESEPEPQSAPEPQLIPELSHEHGLESGFESEPETVHVPDESVEPETAYIPGYIAEPETAYVAETEVISVIEPVFFTWTIFIPEPEPERKSEPEPEAEPAPVPASEMQPVIAQAPAIPDPPVAREPVLAIDPYHTIDYFASQGIRFVQEENPSDKLGKQLKSFTDWLRVMKRLPQKQEEALPDPATEHRILAFAAHSNETREIVTETMAEVLAMQGMSGKAADVYRKLSLLNPEKSAYFAAKIEQLKVK